MIQQKMLCKFEFGFCFSCAYFILPNLLILIYTFDRTPKLYCEDQDCPIELFHPPEDCNVNSSLSFTLQVLIRMERSLPWDLHFCIDVHSVAFSDLQS